MQKIILVKRFSWKDYIQVYVYTHTHTSAHTHTRTTKEQENNAKEKITLLKSEVGIYECQLESQKCNHRCVLPEEDSIDICK